MKIAGEDIENTVAEILLRWCEKRNLYFETFLVTFRDGNDFPENTIAYVDMNNRTVSWEDDWYMGVIDCILLGFLPLSDCYINNIYYMVDGIDLNNLDVVNQ